MKVDFRELDNDKDNLWLQPLILHLRLKQTHSHGTHNRCQQAFNDHGQHVNYIL